MADQDLKVDHAEPVDPDEADLKSRATRQRQRQGLRRSKRHTRTVLLGTLAVAAAIVWMAREWELDTETLLDYLLTGFLFIAVPIGVAVIAGGLLWLVMRWFRK